MDLLKKKDTIGIRRGVVYTRDSQPKSCPVDSPALWSPIVRRCAIADRASVIKEIRRIFGVHDVLGAEAGLNPTFKLQDWHNECLKEFVVHIAAGPQEWSDIADKSHIHMSFNLGFSKENQMIFNIEGVELAARRALDRTLDHVSTGWSMFWQPRVPELQGRVFLDRSGHREVEGIEVNLASSLSSPNTLPDVWRITTEGRGSILRAFREDRQGWPLPSGRTLSVFLRIQDVYEFVRFCFEYAMIVGAKDVEMLFDFRGIAGRTLVTRDADKVFPERKNTQENSRKISIWSPIDDIESDIINIVRRVVGDVLVLYGRYRLTLDEVRQSVVLFRSMPKENWHS